MTRLANETESDTGTAITVGGFQIRPLLHPQGCRGYLIVDPESRQALAVDVHLDHVHAARQAIEASGCELTHVVDTHTHADHPSGSAALAERFAATRVAHRDAGHTGVARHPADGERLHLGDRAVTVRHAPGHTPDHMVLQIDGAVFSGDSLLIGAVARTDFLGGDAGVLFDSLRRVFDGLPDETVVFPGHDYQGRMRTTLGDERRDNPWLRMTDRETFVSQLTANRPPRPANMDDLLRLNREGVHIPDSISAADAAALVAAGGGASIVDVRTPVEFDGEHVEGSTLIPVDRVAERADEVRRIAAPRLLLCRSGQRARMAQQELAKRHVTGLRVVEGGIEALRAAGEATVRGQGGMSLERQVRIAAGSLVLTGALLALLVHPAFVGLSVFVGAGLVFAGITDWCGMGLLLAKAPWNRRGGGATAASPAAACSAGVPASCSAAPATATGVASDRVESGGCAAEPPTAG